MVPDAESPRLREQKFVLPRFPTRCNVQRFVEWTTTNVRDVISLPSRAMPFFEEPKEDAILKRAP